MNSEATLQSAAGPVRPAPVRRHHRPNTSNPRSALLLKEADAALETVTQEAFPADWAAMASTLDVATERLGRAWGAVSHLNSVADTPELRAAYNKALPAVTDFWTRLGSDERLYAKYKAMDPAQLTAEQTQAHTNAKRGFVLGGADLQGEAKTAFCLASGAPGRTGTKIQRKRARRDRCVLSGGARREPQGRARPMCCRPPLRPLKPMDSKATS